MGLERIFHTESGRIIISVLLGLGLSTLFRKECIGRNCIEFVAPTLEDIKKKVYKYGTNCFKYEIESNKCDNSKKSINFT
jgi:hypothetical protein